MKLKVKRCFKVALTCLVFSACALATIVSANMIAGTPIQKSFADESTVNSYTEAKSALATYKSQNEEIMGRVSEIYSQIESTTDKILAVQAVMVEKQSEYNRLIKYEYVNDVQYSLILQLIDSQNFDEFMQNIDYANSIMDYQFRVAKDAHAEKVKFDAVLNELNMKVLEQNQLLNESSQNISKATEMIASLRSKLTPDELADLEGIRTEMSQESSSGGFFPNPEPAPYTPDDPSPDPGPSPTPTPDPGPSPTPTPPPPSPEPSWSTGIASAYGGSTDPSTPPGSKTATGEDCDDWTTGVAVPMAWPNYRSYFHHTVMIS